MTMRLWYQSMAPLGHLDTYAEALRRRAKAVLPEAEVALHGAAHPAFTGRPPADIHKYAYGKHIVHREAFDVCRRAEKEGYDAVILGSFGEPYLTEVRSLLDIPVVSMVEASLLLACSLAENFALVTLSPANVRRVGAVVKRHGLEGRITGILSLKTPVKEDELNEAIAKPNRVVPAFLEVAEEAVRDGADAVIPAEGLFSEVMVAHGVKKVSEAAVIDCVGASLLQAEMLVRAKRLGLGVGRRWSYARPPGDLLEVLDRAEKP